MADDNIKISVEVDTGDSADELERVRKVTEDTGEELDQLDAKTVEVDVKVDADAASDSIRRVGSEADGSKDALANMVGNTTGELGELAGIGGVAGQALGQVAEYAADGKVGLKGLVATGPAIAGLGLLMYGLEQRAKDAAKRLENMAEAAENLGRVADDQVLQEFGRYLGNAAFSGKDLGEALTELAEKDLPAYRRTLDLATTSGDVSASMLAAMRAALAEVEAEMAQQERTAREYAGELDAAAAGAEVLEGVLAGTFVEVLGTVEGAMSGAASATEEMNRQTEELLGRIDDRQAWLNAQEAVEDYVRAVGDGESSTRDQERAWLNAAETLVRYVQGLEGVPDSVKTEVLAAIDEGDLGKAYAILDELTRTRTVRINLATGTITGALAGVLAGQTLNVRTNTAGGSARAVNVTNYYPPRVSPTEQYRAQRTFVRVYGG